MAARLLCGSLHLRFARLFFLFAGCLSYLDERHGRRDPTRYLDSGGVFRSMHGDASRAASELIRECVATLWFLEWSIWVREGGARWCITQGMGTGFGCGPGKRYLSRYETGIPAGVSY